MQSPFAQVVKVQHGNFEISCVIDPDPKRFLKIIFMGQTAESRPSAIQTNDLATSSSTEVPDELKRTIGSHLWLANFEATGKKMIPQHRQVVVTPKDSFLGYSGQYKSHCM